jgi:hypothetical protein
MITFKQRPSRCHCLLFRRSRGTADIYHRFRHRIQQEYDAENQPPTGNPATESRSKRQMWVDKYRPQKFTDLLGEEVSLFAFRSVAGIRLATY